MSKNNLMIFAFGLLLCPTSALAGAEEDGAAVFFNLCGGTVAHVETPFDPSSFKFTKLGPDVLRKIRPNEEGPFWDVQSSNSDMRGLVHIWTNGNCSFEVIKADEKVTRDAYERELSKFALQLHGTVERRPDKVTITEDMPMASSEWLLSSSKGKFLLGLTTYPIAKFMTQHIMLMRQVG